MTAVRFTLADLERASAAWNCTCGPSALAAVAGLILSALGVWFHPSLPPNRQR